MTYLWLILFLTVSFSSANALECVQLKKSTRIKHISSKKIQKAFRGEQLVFQKSLNKKLDIIELAGEPYKIFKRNYDKKKQPCFEGLNLCYRAKKDLLLRNSVLKKHKKIAVSKGKKLQLASFLKRKSRTYYRLSVKPTEYVWVSKKQLKSYFSKNCEDNPEYADDTAPSLAVNNDNTTDKSEPQPIIDPYEDSVGTLEQSIQDSKGITDAAESGPETTIEAEAEASKTKEKPSRSYWGFYVGADVGASSKFLDEFIDDIDDPNNVKNEPDPIIRSIDKGQAFYAQAFYERSLFYEKLNLRLGLGYRYENFVMQTKKNPASAASIVRLDSLEDGELTVNLSGIEVKSGVSYDFFLWGFLLKPGLTLGVNYYLTGDLVVDRRVGPTKATADQSVLSLDAIQLTLEPQLELQLRMGLFFGLKYRYLIGNGGNVGVYSGYRF